MYIEDEETELSVLVDRAVGGTSLVDGQVELMLHRYAYLPTLAFTQVACDKKLVLNHDGQSLSCL